MLINYIIHVDNLILIENVTVSYQCFNNETSLREAQLGHQLWSRLRPILQNDHNYCGDSC